MTPDLHNATIARIQKVLDEVVATGAMAKFDLRYKAVWSRNKGEFLVVLYRHVLCVEDMKERDFRMAAAVDLGHPLAVSDFETYVGVVLRDLVARAFIHEVDEGLRRNGAPLVDPHPDGDLGIKGLYVRWPLL